MDYFKTGGAVLFGFKGSHSSMGAGSEGRYHPSNS